MARDNTPPPGHPPAGGPGQQPVPTTDSEEWGERVETGRQIARGGKEEGCPPGATGDSPGDPRAGTDRCGRP